MTAIGRIDRLCITAMGGTRFRFVCGSLVLALAYLIAGRIGLSLPYMGTTVSLIWPPTGIAFWAVWRYGRAALPALVAGSFAVNIGASGSLPFSIVVAIGDSLPAVAGALLLRRLGQEDLFANPRSVFRFVAAAAAIGPLLSASIGTLSLAAMAGGQGNPSLTWLVWWAGDALGVLVVAPPLLTLRRWTRGFGPGTAEAALAGLLLPSLWVVMFALPANPALGPLSYLAVPAVIWIAVRFPPHVVTLWVLLLSAVAVIGTAGGHGPFAHGDFRQSFAYLHGFLAVIALVGLFLSAATAEAEAAMAALRRESADKEAARMAAERAALAKARFLAVMSHEIRTPMNSILGMTELAMGDTLPPCQRERVEIVSEAAHGLLRILDDILDVSRLERGDMPFETVGFDLRKLATSVCAAMAPPAREKGLEIACRIEDGVPHTLSGDPARLRQILVNLMGNAVKFTPSGSVVLSVGPAGPPAGDGMPLRFAVADTGIGIPPERLADIFDPFVQASPGAHGGTGLGLSICRHLVQAMGGTIAVRSAPGAGSTFSFALRLGVPAPTGEAAAKPPARAHPPSLSILLAEDNALNRQVTSALLARRGYAVTAAADGGEAVELARQGGFDLVLMDMAMPGLDGIDAARAVRALPPPAGNVPIIALTANAFPDDVERCLAAGMNGHVAKPLDPEAFDRAVAAVCPALGGGDSRPAVDEAALRKLRDLVGERDWAGFLRLFLDNGGALHARIRDAARDGDFAATAEAAHDLKGMARYACCPALGELCGDIETACKDGATGAVGSLLGRLAAEWSRAEAEVATVYAVAADAGKDV
ncbi:MAG: MASE1 domain-containing protein [Magnetospirillum sp.]|nr:MASE1 domain-containing protein [Magnetospirillum sp.]